MPVEFECKDIGNQNCGFKTEANTPEELITKVNQHVRSAHGINPTDAQERVERAIKEKESWRGSGTLMGETGSTSPMSQFSPNPANSTQENETAGWNQSRPQSYQQTQQEETSPSGPESTYQSSSQLGQPGWQTQRFGKQQGEEYQQTGQESSTVQQYSGQTGTQSQMETKDTQYSPTTTSTSSQRGRNMSQTATSGNEEEE